MKHASIRELFDYWNTRRGIRAMPDRGDIEPSAIRRVLADTFILAVDARAGHPFRIAGTRVCAAFGRELKGAPFTELWTAESIAQVRDLLAVVTGESIGIVGAATGHSQDGAALDLEMLVLPLAHRNRTDARILGALAPRDTPYWLGVSTLGPLSLGTIRYLGRATEPVAASHKFAWARPARRGRHGLVVYEGGQA